MQNDYMETLIPDNNQSKDEDELFRSEFKINVPRQIFAMMWKHSLQMWRMKGQSMWVIMAPALAGICLHYLS